MNDNLHDVVKLLLARMESHPDEFGGELSIDGSRTGRWWQVIRTVRDCGTEAEIDAVNVGIREIKLQRAHEIMMDELLNGDERRRREIEEQEYERRMSRNTLHGVNPTHVWTDDYANVGVGTAAPSQPLTIRAGAAEVTRIQTNSEIKIGNETLSEELLKQMKKALNI